MDTQTNKKSLKYLFHPFLSLSLLPSVLDNIRHGQIRPRPSPPLLGLLHRGPRLEADAILFNVQRFQANALSSLFHVQPLRAEYGPPLSVDKFLHRLLQQKVLYANDFLFEHYNYKHNYRKFNACI